MVVRSRTDESSSQLMRYSEIAAELRASHRDLPFRRGFSTPVIRMEGNARQHCGIQPAVLDSSCRLSPIASCVARAGIRRTPCGRYLRWVPLQTPKPHRRGLSTKLERRSAVCHCVSSFVMRLFEFHSLRPLVHHEVFSTRSAGSESRRPSRIVWIGPIYRAPHQPALRPLRGARGSSKCFGFRIQRMRMPTRNCNVQRPLESFRLGHLHCSSEGTH